MDVSNLAALSLLHQRRASNVVPHLSACHGKDKAQGQKTPSSLVVQELEIIPPQVQQASSNSKEDEHGNGASVIRRPEDSDIDISTLSNPPA